MKSFFEKKYFIRQNFCHSTVKNLPPLLLNKKIGNAEFINVTLTYNEEICWLLFNENRN